MNPKELEVNLMNTGILDAVKHERLIQDIAHVQETANIPVQFITSSMKDHCPMNDVDFVVHYNKGKAAGIAGMVMVNQPNVDTRMMAICGAFVRNYIDARVIPLNTLMAMQEAGTLPSPTVLLIPNLFLTTVGKALPAWKIQIVYDMLLSRFVGGKTTILYVENLAGLEAAYGQVFVDHLKSNYKIVG